MRRITTLAALVAALFLTVTLSSQKANGPDGAFQSQADYGVAGQWTYNRSSNPICLEGATINAFQTCVTATDPTAARVLTLPDATDTLVGKATTDVLTNKTLTTPIIGVLNDSASVNRLIANATAKTIVDGSATSLFEVPISAASYAAGMVNFAVFASDGTDHQVISGILTYSGENKAGTIVRAATYVAANEAKSVSSGTLTLAFTATDDTNKMTVKLQPTGSLTETTYTVVYTVVPLKGTVAIL